MKFRPKASFQLIANYVGLVTCLFPLRGAGFNGQVTNSLRAVRHSVREPGGVNLQIEGLVKYEIGVRGAPNYHQKLRTFSVVLRGNQWNIQTTPLNEDPHLAMGFDAAAYDGSNIFYLSQSDPELLRKTIDVNAYPGKFADAIATVRRAVTPELRVDDINFLWQVFASKPYYTSLTNGLSVAPLWDSDRWVSTVWLGSTDPAFLDEIDWVSDGAIEINDGGSTHLERALPPYESGFTEEQMLVKAWTNYDGITLPQSFAIIAFRPGSTAATATNLFPRFEVTGTTLRVGAAPGKSILPEVTSLTLVADFRRTGPKGEPLVYRMEKNWLETDKALSGKLLAARGLISPSASLRPTIIGGVMLLVTVTFTFLFWRAVKLQRKR